MVIMRHGSANRSNGSPLKLHTIRVDPKTSKTNASFSSMIKIKSHGIQAFFISNTFISRTPSWNWQKIKQMLSNTLRLNFCYFKIIHILHLRHHQKIIGQILKNKQKHKCVRIHEITGLIIMKMKMKNRSHSYAINRTTPRHGGKYGKSEKCISNDSFMY